MAQQLYAIQAKRHETMQARAALEGLRGWKTLAYATEAQVEERKRELLERLGAAAKHVELRARAKNPADHHHVAAETTKIGVVLDLVTQFGSTRTTWDMEPGAWHMLIEDDAFSRAPGEAPLFLVRGTKTAADRVELKPRARGREAYNAWNERDPVEIFELSEIPDLIPIYVGRAMTIGYRSDKWNGRGDEVDYTHSFTERGHIPPEVWADVADIERARALVIIGGDMRITVDGID